MKNIFYLLFIFSIASLSAQVDYSKKFITKKFQTAILNYDDNNYYFDGEAVDFKVQLVPEENYYILAPEGEDEEKISWEYVTSNESVMIYEDEDFSRIDFDFQAGQIRVYLEYNETTEFYENLMILSELEVVRKNPSKDYNPNKNRAEGDYGHEGEYDPNSRDRYNYDPKSGD